MTGNSRAQERGSSAVEFSLVVAAMAAMIVAVVMGAGPIVKSLFEQGCSSFATQASESGCPSQEIPEDATAQSLAPPVGVDTIS